MSGIDPVSLAISGLTTVASMKQARSQAKAQAAAQARAANAQRQQILETRKIEERQEKKRLRRELAAKRARFGAGGVGTGGSAAAVLSGLTAASNQRLADRRRLENLTLSQLDSPTSPGPSLFEEGLGLATGLLGQFEGQLPKISLFDPSPTKTVSRGRVRPIQRDFRATQPIGRRHRI